MTQAIQSSENSSGPRILGGLGKTWRHVCNAVPPLRILVGGTLLWAIAMAFSALLDLVQSEWATPAHIRTVVTLFLTGGALAFPVGLYLARFFSLGRRPEVAFAAAFVCLVSMTIAFTGTVFALQYRLYYSEWHAPAFTSLWFHEFVFTFAAALYQFAVLGMRLYFPTGFIVVFLVSLWFARRNTAHLAR